MMVVIGVQALEHSSCIKVLNGLRLTPVGCGHGGRQVLHVVVVEELQPTEIN